MSDLIVFLLSFENFTGLKHIQSNFVYRMWMALHAMVLPVYGLTFLCGHKQGAKFPLIVLPPKRCLGQEHIGT